MKTNQIVERQMGNFVIHQRTKDSMFDASSLLQQWNEKNPTMKKKISNFTKNEPTKQFIEELGKELKINEGRLNRFRQDTDNQEFDEPIVMATVKGREIKGGGKTPDKVWMHPYLFIKFAMWLNPRFEVQVIKFVYDQLISLRNQIGTEYKEFSEACAQVGCSDPEEYQNLTRCLNCSVLGANRQTNQRNSLTETEAMELQKIQNIFIEAVRNGWIGTIDEAKQFFKREYNKKFKKLPF